MPRSHKIESPKVYRGRLGSFAARSAIKQLCGNDAAAAKRLRTMLTMWPGAWKLTIDETLPEVKKRRTRLALKLRTAATALKNDIEHWDLTLLELRTGANDWQLHFLTSRATNCPTIVEVITQVADLVVEHREYDDETPLSRRGLDLKAFCLLNLHGWIASWPKFKGYTSRVELQKDEKGSSVWREIKITNCRRLRSPNRQLEILIGALLKMDIQKDTLTHLLGPNGRRKYTKDRALN